MRCCWRQSQAKEAEEASGESSRAGGAERDANAGSAAPPAAAAAPSSRQPRWRRRTRPLCLPAALPVVRRPTTTEAVPGRPCHPLRTTRGSTWGTVRPPRPAGAAACSSKSQPLSPPPPRDGFLTHSESKVATRKRSRARGLIHRKRACLGSRVSGEVSTRDSPHHTWTSNVVAHIVH